jgi:hypothetical protein
VQNYTIEEIMQSISYECRASARPVSITFDGAYTPVSSKGGIGERRFEILFRTGTEIISMDPAIYAQQIVQAIVAKKAELLPPDRLGEIPVIYHITVDSLQIMPSFAQQLMQSLYSTITSAIQSSVGPIIPTTHLEIHYDKLPAAYKQELVRSLCRGIAAAKATHKATPPYGIYVLGCKDIREQSVIKCWINGILATSTVAFTSRVVTEISMEVKASRAAILSWGPETPPSSKVSSLPPVRVTSTGARKDVQVTNPLRSATAVHYGTAGKQQVESKDDKACCGALFSCFA